MGHKNFDAQVTAQRPSLIYSEVDHYIFVRRIRGKIQLIEFTLGDVNTSFKFDATQMRVEGKFLRNGRLWDNLDLAVKYLVKYLGLDLTKVNRLI